MIAWAVLLAVGVSTQQQQPGGQLRALVQAGDSAALTAEVRRRPADARQLLGELIQQAGRARPGTDSVIGLARRLARTYAATWDDSFPVANLERFERLSAKQRAAKNAADSVRLAGNSASTRQRLSTAMALWRQALRRSAAVPDSAGMAAALGNIGSGFYQESQLDSAEVYLTRATLLAHAVGDKRTAANALGVLGASAMDRGDMRRADEIMRRSLALRWPIGDVRGAAADHTNLGLIAAELGDVGAAREHYLEALELARQHELSEPAATALLNLGNIASQIGELVEADARYAEALSLFRAIGNDADVALVLQNRGLLALRRGDYARATTQLQEALAIFTRAGTVENLIQVRRDLASVRAATGDLRSALDQLRRAELLLATMAEPGELPADIALARGDLATLLNTYAIAEQQYGIAQTIYRREGNSFGEAEAQQGRAMLLVERKQYAKALELLGAAKRVQTASGDRRPAALTALMIGHTQQQQGNLVVARRTFAQALDTLRALGDVGGEAAALVALGDLELDAQSALAAEAQYRRALERLSGRAVPTVSWQAHAGLGRALRARGALDEAAVELRASIADVERTARTLPLAERRATFLGDKWEAFADLALTQRALGDAAASFATSERMRARQMLDVLSRGRIARATPADTVLSAREQDLRLQIGDLTQRLESEEGGVRTLRGPELAGASSGVTREALARVQEQYAQLLLELRDEKGYGAMVATDPTPWRVVAARLKRGQAMLTYLVTDSTTMVFVLTPDTMRVLDLNVGHAALAALVDFARGTVARRPATSTPAWRTPLARLHQQLITPIEDAGLLAGVRELVIVPHAELHYLPFASLVRRGTKDEFLIERYDIGYAPSATAWVQLGARDWPLGNRVLALAPRDQQLPGSRDEVEAIRGLYGSDATVLTGAAATEQVFRATVQRYGIVHLATYGVLNQHNPLFSFVELNRGGGDDGRLEVHEVFALSLNARLLVLSACQTALASGAVSDVPAGDDWVGLVRAFLGAGAQNVIATLWAVEDRSTARVMERLHKRLRAGDSEAVALSQAQRETLRNPATAGPFYWAGFVLVGGR